MPQLEAQARCAWHKFVPERCGTLLDAHSHHAQVCCKFLHTRRHNAIRNLIQKFATKAGYTALAEQLALSATTCPETQPDTQASTRRGLERADLHLVSPEGVGVYIDLRITTVPYAADVVTHLAEQERQKRQQYARAAVKPVIISTLGHLAMDAHALLSQITSQHARSALHEDNTWAALLANARRALFQPLSVLLLRNAATAEGSCTGQARLTTDMQHNARRNQDVQGKIAPTLASRRAQQHALILPDEPITASHAAQLPPT
eukprot:5646471-Amphidinium_carterae.1